MANVGVRQGDSFQEMNAGTIRQPAVVPSNAGDFA
jgi:hypothetical protein